MLCLKPLDELLEFAEKIKGVAMAKERRRGCWNNGSMVIGKKYMTDKTYKELLTFNQSNPKYKDYYGHDQKIYNIYFSSHKIKKVHQRFNTLVSEMGFIGKKDIVIMHYFYKPTLDIGRHHLSTWQIEQWEKYDDPEGRFSKIDS